MEIELTAEEFAELHRQNPATKRDGGWQSLLVGLQRSVIPGTRTIRLTKAQLEQIARYAFDYGKGGWETRLLAIFGRALGNNLGRG